MKEITASDKLLIPAGVKVTVKSREVYVKGPRGVLTRSFKHTTVDMALTKVAGKTYLVVKRYFPSRKEQALIRTVIAHIANMITGVTKGFVYKMRLVYAHFPINATITNNGQLLELRNFLGEKIVRRVPMLGDVKIVRSEGRDELVLTGNDIELVSQSAARVHESCLVKVKDIRKFLDGIYVSEKGVIGEI